MTFQITTTGQILIDNKTTGLLVAQSAQSTPKATKVYAADKWGNAGQQLTMPHAFYALGASDPRNPVPGYDQFQADIRALLANQE